MLFAGTSDEHLSLLEHMAPVHSKLSGVIVTTPQAVALIDAIKCLSFTRTVNLPILGLIENMSGYVCPCCGEISNIFSTGGGEEMARREGIPFLGNMPLDTEVVTLLDGAEMEPSSGGMNVEAVREQSIGVLQRYQNTSSARLFQSIVGKIIENLLKL